MYMIANLKNPLPFVIMFTGKMRLRVYNPKLKENCTNTTTTYLNMKNSHGAYKINAYKNSGYKANGFSSYFVYIDNTPS